MTLVVFGEDSIVFFPIISVLGVAEDGIRSASRPSVKRERERVYCQYEADVHGHKIRGDLHWKIVLRQIFLREVCMSAISHCNQQRPAYQSSLRRLGGTQLQAWRVAFCVFHS